MKLFEMPEIEVLKLAVMDVIATSGVTSETEEPEPPSYDAEQFCI